MEHKFKFGDKVIRTGDTDKEVFTVIGFDDKDVDCNGDTIFAVHRKEGRPYDSAIWFNPDRLQLAVPQPAEFHVGDVVRVNLGCTLNEINGAVETFHFLDNYLIDPDCEYIVDKVFSDGTVRLQDTDGYVVSTACLELVHSAPQPKEMTMEELEKALGYPVKIIKGDADGNS